MAPFSPQDRTHVREQILRKARADARIVSAAAVGSAAAGREDRWSDLDLTFGLADGVALEPVLSEWTHDLEHALGARFLFEVRDRWTVYRVFLLPGSLQVDLSFTPGGAADYGPRFRLLFGNATRMDRAPATSAREAFGLGVHHAVRARISVERGRTWQADHWIRGVRDQALQLACLRRSLEHHHGRGYDELPKGVLDAALECAPRSVERDELLRALGRSVDLLLAEAAEPGTFRETLEPELRGLTERGWT